MGVWLGGGDETINRSEEGGGGEVVTGDALVWEQRSQRDLTKPFTSKI